MRRTLPLWTRKFYLSIDVLVLVFSFLSFIALSSPVVQAGIHTQANTLGGCQVFPTSNVWNADISSLPVHANSANYIASMALGGHVHPDFGAGLYDGGPIGIPFVVVPPNQPLVPVSFTYASESDPGPYPVPANAPVEGGAQSSGDRHVLVVQSGTCTLYEMFAAYPQKNGNWQAGSGAVWKLSSNALRPATWTSADAAGLPILPGLVTYDEVAAGTIHHALRFTANQTQNAFLWPARHAASSSGNPALPPMGLRVRLKANVDISAFSRTNQIILTALKHYGMILADNGSSWFISGAPDDRWNNDDLHALTTIPGSDFEAVDESSLRVNVNSGAVAGVPAPTPTVTASPSSTSSPQVTRTTITLLQETERRETYSNASANTKNASAVSSPLVILLMGTIMVLALGLVGTFLVLRRRKRARGS